MCSYAHSVISADDHCATNPCQNGAECVNAPLGFSCVCRYGYAGTLCDRGMERSLMSYTCFTSLLQDYNLQTLNKKITFPACFVLLLINTSLSGLLKKKYVTNISELHFHINCLEI